MKRTKPVQTHPEPTPEPPPKKSCLKKPAPERSLKQKEMLHAYKADVERNREGDVLTVIEMLRGMGPRKGVSFVPGS